MTATGRPGQDNSVHITGSVLQGSAVAGKGGSASAYTVAATTPGAEQAIKLVRELRAALTVLSEADDDDAVGAKVSGAKGQLADLEEELQAPEPRKGRLAALMAGVTASAGGIGAVANLVTALAAAVGAVTRLP